ncbi:MAG: AAA family ATPase [Pseudobutyrivibrio sp.]|nr:AAA family ATPase [Pseudobutyrivibrio sp.]
MGIYLNPNNDNFKKVLANEIYVDKTMMLREMNGFIEKANNYICVSKARRFGKTVAGNMLVEYYSKGCDSLELFDGLSISKDSSYNKSREIYYW